MESTKSFKQILADIQVRPARRREEARYQSLMAEHHYLGALPKIGETLWYVASRASKTPVAPREAASVTGLGIAAGATLCGMSGYKVM